MMNRQNPDNSSRDAITELAMKLDGLAENFEPYEYRDQVDDAQENIQKIIEDLKTGKIKPYLDTVIAESKENAEAAKALKCSLDEINSAKKESVMEKLTQSAKKAEPMKSSVRNKELER